jgi:hypothetical protein
MALSSQNVKGRLALCDEPHSRSNQRSGHGINRPVTSTNVRFSPKWRWASASGAIGRREKSEG